MSAGRDVETATAKAEVSVELEIQHRAPGRLVLAEPCGRLHMGRGYEILCSEDDGATWQRTCAIPRSPLRRAVEQSRLASRLLRHELRALARLSGGGYVASTRQGVFASRPGEVRMTPTRVEASELSLEPPLRITRGPDDEIVWGEYIGRFEGRAIRLFASRDAGASHQVIHTFAPGEVDHVHNLVWDASRDHYWVLTGDMEDAAGIGILSRDLERFEWWRRGDQAYRVVDLFDMGDHFVYANDTQLETNGLFRLDKNSGEVERLRDFDGSCIDACRFGGLFAITTTVEPSSVNLSQFVTLWLSRDGFDWKQAYRGVKDRWHVHLFQYGRILLPAGRSGRELVCFSTQALRGNDGMSFVARLADPSSL